VIAVLVTALFVARANADQLIVNGGFESGFTGWTVTDQAGGSGSFFIDDNDGSTPLTGEPTVGPASGSAYAVSDQGGPGTHALTQAFTVPAGASNVVLSFDMFVNDWDGGPIINPAGLDYTAFANQHARVDILSNGSGAFDTGAGVLQNFYLGVDAGNDPHVYTPYSFNITSLVSGGGTFILRFAEVDNQSFFNQGVDNVGIQASVVPLPLGVLAGLALMGSVGAQRVIRRVRGGQSGVLEALA
jgi:hypothetical protein